MALRKPTLPERIDAALSGKFSMTFHDLALAVFPDARSHRYQSNGGPPGCYMSLSACLRRNGYPQSWREVGPGGRIVYARKSPIPLPASREAVGDVV